MAGVNSCTCIQGIHLIQGAAAGRDCPLSGQPSQCSSPAIFIESWDAFINDTPSFATGCRRTSAFVLLRISTNAVSNSSKNRKRRSRFMFLFQHGLIKEWRMPSQTPKIRGCSEPFSIMIFQIASFCIMYFCTVCAHHDFAFAHPQTVAFGIKMFHVAIRLDEHNRTIFQFNPLPTNIAACKGGGSRKCPLNKAFTRMSQVSA